MNDFIVLTKFIINFEKITQINEKKRDLFIKNIFRLVR